MAWRDRPEKERSGDEEGEERRWGDGEGEERRGDGEGEGRRERHRSVCQCVSVNRFGEEFINSVNRVQCRYTLNPHYLMYSVLDSVSALALTCGIAPRLVGVRSAWNVGDSSVQKR